MNPKSRPTPRELRRAPLVDHFRSALARRHVPDLEVFRVERASALTCVSCLDATARARDLVVERLEPLPDDTSVVEAYDALSWWTTQEPEADEAGDVRDASAPGTRVRSSPPERLGLYRIGRARGAAPDEALWLWLYEFGEWDEAGACLGARRREDVERLAHECERRHVEHERERPGLLLVGECDEERAACEPVAWADVLLPDELRRDLEATVREFFASRELYRRHRLAYRRGLLLAGPPGNGKTTILRAIRATAGVPVVVASGLNEARRGQLIARAFARAANLAPSVLCFEDLDALVEDGPALSLFLNRLDGLASLEGVLVVATTNRPDRIDPAIAKRPSRFDRVFSIPAPDRALRASYFTRALGSDVPAGSVEWLAAETDGWSVAFLKELVVQARFAALRRREERVGAGDLDAALASVGEHVRLAVRSLEDRGGIGFSG